jgi:hypothetical protein
MLRGWHRFVILLRGCSLPSAAAVTPVGAAPTIPGALAGALVDAPSTVALTGARAPVPASSTTSAAYPWGPVFAPATGVLTRAHRRAAVPTPATAIRPLALLWEPVSASRTWPWPVAAIADARTARLAALVFHINFRAIRQPSCALAFRRARRRVVNVAGVYPMVALIATFPRVRHKPSGAMTPARTPFGPPHAAIRRF